MTKPAFDPSSNPLEPRSSQSQQVSPVGGFDPQSLDPDTIAAHYRLLDLRPGATIEEVDQAYFRLKRQTPREQLAALKTAHQTVKGMLLHYFAEQEGDPRETSPASDQEEAQRGNTPFLVQLVRQWLEQGGVTAEVTWKEPDLHIRVPVQRYPTPNKVLPKIQRSLQKLTDGERQGLGSIKCMECNGEIMCPGNRISAYPPSGQVLDCPVRRCRS